LLNDKGVPAPDNGPGRCVVFKVPDVSSALGVSPDAVTSFLALARKAHMIGQNGEWVWVPYPQYLLPFAEYLTNAARSSTA
jgi:hypothetical protein